MSKKNLLLATSTFGENLEKKHLNNLRKKFNITFNPYKRKLTKEELIILLNDNSIEYVIAGLESYDAEVLDNSKIKIISRLGSGTSNINQKLTKMKKIKVFSTPKAPVDAVSELTLGMMINLLRNSTKMNSTMHQKTWKRLPGNLLKDKSVLIVGYGNIGKNLERLLRPFKANVILCDINFKSNKTNTFKSLSKAIPKADIISFHVDKDISLMKAKEFKLLKKGVIILNSSRGGVINEDLLIQYIKNRKIQSAWIDVFSEEPYKGKLCGLENVLLTPHVGSFTIETRRNMEINAIKNITDNIK